VAVPSDIVLTAIDLDDSSARVVEVAFELAARLHWRVILVHVLLFPVHGYIELGPERMEEFRARMAEWARSRIDELRSEHGAARALLYEGDPAVEILRAIDELDPAIVVIGTHGRGRVARILLGSVAIDVVRRSRAPVLTVPQRDGRIREKPPRAA
jgi:nucleotide-binding universal stress UspA family protein